MGQQLGDYTTDPRATTSGGVPPPPTTGNILTLAACHPVCVDVPKPLPTRNHCGYAFASMGREVWNPTGCAQPPLAPALTSSLGQLPLPRHQLQSILLIAQARPCTTPHSATGQFPVTMAFCIVRGHKPQSLLLPPPHQKGHPQIGAAHRGAASHSPPHVGTGLSSALGNPLGIVEWPPPPKRHCRRFGPSGTIESCSGISCPTTPPPSANTGNLGSTPQAATATGRSHVHASGDVEEATGRGQAKKLAPSCHPMSYGRACADHSSCLDFLSLFGGGISHYRAMYGPRHTGGHQGNGTHGAPSRAAGPLTPNPPWSCLLVCSHSLVGPAQFGPIQAPPPPPSWDLFLSMRLQVLQRWSLHPQPTLPAEETQLLHHAIKQLKETGHLQHPRVQQVGSRSPPKAPRATTQKTEKGPVCRTNGRVTQGAGGQVQAGRMGNHIYGRIIRGPSHGGTGGGPWGVLRGLPGHRNAYPR